MKAIKIFSMAAVALLMAACSNNDELTQQAPAKDGKMYFTATIGPAGGGTVTRTIYNEVNDGTAHARINVAWRAKEGDQEGDYEGDKIALIHGHGIKDVVTVTKVNDDGSAVIEGLITVPEDDEEAVALVYPADIVAWAIDGTSYSQAIDYDKRFLNQDGSLEYIQNNLDSRQGSGWIVKKSSTKATLMENVTMESLDAIWKITLTTDGTTPLEATQLTLKKGSTDIATATLASGATDVFYLSVYLRDLAGAGNLYTISATNGTNVYDFKKTGLSLTAGYYYQSKLTMKPYPIAATDVTSGYVGSVLTADGMIYPSIANAEEAGKTPEAVIAHVGAVTNYCDKFIAIALNDVSISGTQSEDGISWADALTAVGTYAAAHAITIGGTTYNTNTTGDTYYDKVSDDNTLSSATRPANPGLVKGWRLPSMTDWRYMYAGIGGLVEPTPTDPVGITAGILYGDAGSHNTNVNRILATNVNSACGNTDFRYSNYWFSSEDNSNAANAWSFSMFEGKFYIYAKTATGYMRARAFFAY